MSDERLRIAAEKIVASIPLAITGFKDEREEQIDRAIKIVERGLELAFSEGEYKQAILENRGRIKFMDDLRNKLCAKCKKVKP